MSGFDSEINYAVSIEVELFPDGRRFLTLSRLDLSRSSFPGDRKRGAGEGRHEEHLLLATNKMTIRTPHQETLFFLPLLYKVVGGKPGTWYAIADISVPRTAEG